MKKLIQLCLFIFMLSIVLPLSLFSKDIIVKATGKTEDEAEYRSYQNLISQLIHYNLDYDITPFSDDDVYIINNINFSTVLNGNTYTSTCTLKNEYLVRSELGYLLSNSLEQYKAGISVLDKATRSITKEDLLQLADTVDAFGTYKLALSALSTINETSYYDETNLTRGEFLGKVKLLLLNMIKERRYVEECNQMMSILLKQKSDIRSSWGLIDDTTITLSELMYALENSIVNEKKEKNTLFDELRIIISDYENEIKTAEDKENCMQTYLSRFEQRKAELQTTMSAEGNRHGLVSGTSLKNNADEIWTSDIFNYLDYYHTYMTDAFVTRKDTNSILLHILFFDSYKSFAINITPSISQYMDYLLEYPELMNVVTEISYEKNNDNIKLIAKKVTLLPPKNNNIVLVLTDDLPFYQKSLYDIPNSDTVVFPAVTITFDSNHGEFKFTDVKVPKNFTYIIPNATPKRSGYKFIGWELNGKRYKQNEEIQIKSSDISLYAIWEEKEPFDPELAIGVHTGISIALGQEEFESNSVPVAIGAYARINKPFMIAADLSVMVYGGFSGNIYAGIKLFDLPPFIMTDLNTNHSEELPTYLNIYGVVGVETFKNSSDIKVFPAIGIGMSVTCDMFSLGSDISIFGNNIRTRFYLQCTLKWNEFFGTI